MSSPADRGAGGVSLSPPVKGAVELSVGEGGSCPQ